MKKLTSALFNGSSTEYMNKIQDSLPSAKWEAINPALAHEYLAKNNNNRRLRPATVSFYAMAMKMGQWYLTHQAIAFDNEGTLIDGQYRLNALIKENKSGVFLVVRGLPTETRTVCDQMLKRQGDDALRWAGEAYKGSCPSSVIRRMAMGMEWDYKISTPELIQISKEYHECVQFALSCFPSNMAHVTTASVKAVLARAYCNKEDEKELRRFSEELYSGVQISSPVARLRDYLIKSPGVRAAVSMREVYAKCEQALDLFLKNKAMVGKLVGTVTELYPLPLDQEKYRDQD